MPSYPHSICRVQSSHGRGTGFLIADDRVLTCWHVVGDTETKQLIDDKPKLSFYDSDQAIQGTVLVDQSDLVEDYAVVQLSPPEGLHPFRLSPIVKNGDRWRTWGFPGVLPSGMPLRGDVIHEFHPVWLDATSSPGKYPEHAKGFSGAPVVLENTDVAIAMIYEVASGVSTDLTPNNMKAMSCERIVGRIPGVTIRTLDVETLAKFGHAGTWLEIEKRIAQDKTAATITVNSARTVISISKDGETTEVPIASLRGMDPQVLESALRLLESKR